MTKKANAGFISQINFRPVARLVTIYSLSPPRAKAPAHSSSTLGAKSQSHTELQLPVYPNLGPLKL